MHTNTLLPETLRIRYNPYKNKLNPKIRDIKLSIYNLLNLDEDFADSHYRNGELVEARQFVHAICYKYRKLFNWSCRMIGKETGSHDHSTVQHSRKTVSALCEFDPGYKKKFDRIERIIKSRFNIDT